MGRLPSKDLVGQLKAATVDRRPVVLRDDLLLVRAPSAQPARFAALATANCCAMTISSGNRYGPASQRMLGHDQAWAGPSLPTQNGCGYVSMTCVPPAALSCQPCFVGLELIVNAMAIAEMNHSNPPTHGIRLSSM